MSDSLTVFGTDYTGVTGIKAKGTGNGTLTYIRPSGTKNIGANGTGIDVTEYASVDVAVPAQDSTFVITVSYNSTTEMWEPDCTWAEVRAAFAAGKELSLRVDGDYVIGVIADGCYNAYDSGGLTTVLYAVRKEYYQTDVYSEDFTIYVWTSNGIEIDETLTTISPSGTYTVDSSGTKDVTNYASVTVPAAVPDVAFNTPEFYTESNQRKWRIQPSCDFPDGEGYGWMGGAVNGNYIVRPAVPANTTITPTTTAQTVGGANYVMERAVTVDAIPSQYIVPSGTATISGSGTTDVTNYASASVAAGSATASATKGTVSNHQVTVTPSVTRTAGWVTAGSANGTAVTVSASELVSGSETKTANGTYDVTNLAQVVVDVQGGESSSMLVDVVEVTSGTSSSISFSGLKGEPVIFDVIIDEALSPSAQATVAALSFDGTTIHGQTITNTSNAQVSYEGASFTKSYSNGTLTITSNGPAFASIPYFLTYAYGGSTSDTDTKDVQVGSGATSITFSGLEDEPIYWSCIFKSNFSTSSGYQRVIFVNNDGNHLVGIAMDSSAHPTTAYWTASYSNGSLTITSSGTNAGGYFHQPGYYQLTYAIGGEVEPEEIDVQPLSVTQNGTYTAPSGTAYSPVTVNVSGSGSVHVGKTTWNNSSTSTVSHQFTGLSGTPKAAFLRCTSQLTRSSSNTYYYIADIVWDGTDAFGNYHLRSNGSFNNVASDAQSGFNVSVSGTSITFSSDATSRSSAPGSFYNGTYELVYIY